MPNTLAQPSLDTGRMSITSHFKELRKRAFLYFGTLLGCFGLAMYWHSFLWKGASLPLQALPQIVLINLHPAENLWMELKLSLYVAITASLPVLIWQVFQFIAPALSPKTQTRSTPVLVYFSIASFVLAAAGASFAFGILFPFLLAFLSAYASDSILQYWSQANYLQFLGSTVLSFAVLFQMPLLSYFLAAVGLLSAHTLWKIRTVAVFMCCFLGALLSPPDAASMFVVAAPVFILYLLSIASSHLAWIQHNSEIRGVP
jgi:sec-independent protein translocase protein TatC